LCIAETPMTLAVVAGSAPTPSGQPPDALANALRWLAVAFMAVGMCCGGGQAAQEAWEEFNQRPRQRQARDRQDPIEREVARGLAELERFLDQQPHG